LQILIFSPFGCYFMVMLNILVSLQISSYN